MEVLHLKDLELYIAAIAGESINNIYVALHEL